MKKTINNLLDKTSNGLRNVLKFNSDTSSKTKSIQKLTDAIVRRDFKAVRKIVARGTPLSELISLYGTISHAIYRLTDGDAKSLSYFFDHGVKATSRDRSNNTLLDTLVIEGRLDLVQMMINRQGDFEVVSHTEFSTPVQKAVRYQQDAIIKCYLEYSRKLPKGRQLVSDILLETVLADDVELAGLVSDYKFDPTRTALNGTPLLHYVKSERMLYLLVRHGFNIDHKDDNGVSLISRLVVENNEDLVFALLGLGPDLADDVAGLYELVITAAKNNSTRILEVLLEYENSFSSENNQSLEKTSDKNLTAWVLCQAVEDRCSLDVIRFLVSYGADINGRNYCNQTPLMMAAVKNNPYYIRYLTAMDAKVELTDDYGRNALMYAVINCSHKCIKPLLNLTKNIGHTDNKGFDAGLHCVVSGNKRIAEVLLKKGVFLDREYNESRTSLMFAAMTGNLELINILLENGSNIDAVDFKHRTALMYASGNGHYDCVKIMMDFGAKAELEDENGITAAKLAKTCDIANLFEFAEGSLMG